MTIQTATYELLTYAQRRPLHKKIAQYLEATYKATLEPHYAALADHWERAQEADPALSYRILAADSSIQRYANEDALYHLDHAEQVSRLYKAPIPSGLRTQLTRIRADACQELTQFAEANVHYKALATLCSIAVPTTDTRRIARLAFEAISQALRRMGLITRQSVGEQHTRDSLAAHIYMRFAEYAYFTNDTLGLAHATLASLNYAERARALPEVVNACGGLALGLTAMGMPSWGSFYRDRSIALAKTAGSLSAEGFAELLACVQGFHVRDWQAMGVHASRGADLWEHLGDDYRFYVCRVLEGYRLIATGHYDEAYRTFLAFGVDAEDIESAQVRAWALAALAHLDLLQGRPASTALARLAAALQAGKLNLAEQFLCDGVAASAHLKGGDYRGALAAAEAGLEKMLQSPPTLAGALLLSVPSIVEVLLALSGRSTAVGNSPKYLFNRARLACAAATKLARRNRVCRARVEIARGRLAAALGRRHKSKLHYFKGLAEARISALPLEEAMAHSALASQASDSQNRTFHLAEARAILERLGTQWSPWDFS